ncbi:MAG: DUF2156 domain-containing protein [Candidatus Omnitrophica bacterium]|nr:DUF2156 domain-containing protein [Candidatus Omnitrophota bacterium]
MSLRPILYYQPLFNQYVGLRRYTLSVFHFSSLFLWKDYFEFDFQVIDDYLCVFAKHEFGTFLYLPPLGRELNGSIVSQCFDELNRRNSKRSFSRIENVSQEDLKFFDSQKYRAFKKSQEYVYRKEDLTRLKGNRFKSKRSSFNQFVKGNNYSIRPFEKSLKEDCLSLFQRWARNRKGITEDQVYNAMLEENEHTNSLIFENFDELGLRGLVVCVDQKPEAYTFGYPLNDEVFCVLVETTNLDIKGLSVFIFSRFCADESLSQYQYINVMDDFAMENIAKTKQSFHPTALNPSYVVTERE